MKNKNYPQLLIEIIEKLKDYSLGNESVHFTESFTGKDIKLLKELITFKLFLSDTCWDKLSHFVEKEINIQSNERYVFVHIYEKIKYITYGIRTDIDRMISDTYSEYGLIIAEEDAIDRTERHYSRRNRKKQKKVLSEKIVLQKHSKDDLPF